MKILLKVGNNDFYSTFHGVLNVFLESYQHTSKDDWSKEEILEIVNEISLGIYMVRQNQFNYSHNSDMSAHFTKMKLQLKLNLNQVYLNEEVDIYLKSINYDGDFANYVLDTSLDNPIYSI